MKKFFLSFVFIISLFPVAGNNGGYFQFNERCKNAYIEILSLRFENGEEIIQQEKQDNPGNLIPYYLENYIDFLKVIISEEEAVFEKLESNKNYRKDLFSDGDKNSPYYRYCHANLELQWAFARFKFKEYFTAGIEINRAYRLLEKNRKQFPGFTPDNIGMGILHTLIGIIPEKYNWVKRLLGLEGTISLGEEELYKVVDLQSNSSFAYLRTESLFYLTFITLNFKEDQRKAESLWQFYNEDSIHSLSEESLLLIYARARLAMETGKTDEAIRILTERPRGEAYYPFHYLDYLAGKVKMFRQDDDAVEFLFAYIDNFAGLNYIKSAYQHIAWYFLLRGNESLYEQYMNEINYKEDALVGADKRAQLAAEKNIKPSIPILKSRLLFDGSYFNHSLQVIQELSEQEINRLSFHDRIEFVYRKGRIYQKTGKLDSALQWFEATIDAGNEAPYYFAANAALMSGKIYEHKHNWREAQYYYGLVMNFDFDEYKESIQQKAKSGLHRIKRHQ